jgi:hypothetical protein
VVLGRQPALVAGVGLVRPARGLTRPAEVSELLG